MDTSSAPEGTVESDSSAASACSTDQRNGEVSPAVQSGREAPRPSNWERLPATERGRIRGQSQCLEGESAPTPAKDAPRGRGRAACGSVRLDEVCGGIVKSVFLMTGNAVTVVAEGLAAETKQRRVEWAHAGWFPRRRVTAPAVRSRWRSFTTQGGHKPRP